ncbi:NrsF family protein [Chelatococcus sp. GCM10030263]|uniref:NrsF family protein n=1 Tax=Chelatococcus sp. GCM10030263 TaxID=3273387 RepID=UPI00361A03C7
MTDDLITRLAADLKPLRRTALLERLALVITAALVVSAVLMWIWLGLRPDMAEATNTAIFWIKSAYTLILGLFGVWAIERLGRPGTRGRVPLLGALICFVVVSVAAALNYMSAPAHAREEMLMGGTASVCPLYVMALSTPFLVAALAFMRRLAPTSPTWAGAAAGLASGALGAWVYSFHCTEQGLPFLASWYSLGIAAVAAIGALLGRRLLRW